MLVYQRVKKLDHWNIETHGDLEIMMIFQGEASGWQASDPRKNRKGVNDVIKW